MIHLNFLASCKSYLGKVLLLEKNAIGLCDCTDAHTYKAGEKPREEYVDDFDKGYEYDTTTHHESSEHYAPFMFHGTSENHIEKQI